MVETEDKLICSTNSSVDGGLDNDYLSDHNSTSSNGESSQQACVLNGSLNVKKETLVRDSKHSCVLNHYDISGKRIETISPRTFQYLTYCVTELNLSNNKIQILPEAISSLENLEKLNLSHNNLKNIPESCNTLYKLKVLNLSYNSFYETPKCLEIGMDRLMHIDLSHNQISKFLKQPKCSYFLQCLKLSHNFFNSLPLWLFTEQCRSLEELDVSFNFCFDLNTVRLKIPSFRHLRTSVMKSLKKLCINNTGSRMDTISFFSQFESLESYYMGNKTAMEWSRKGIHDTSNHFWDLPMEVFNNPKTVVELSIPNVSLASLPDTISKLEILKVLDVSGNLINWLPDSFGSLKLLEELNLSGCKLAYLPENFNQLSNLKKLFLDRNELSDVRKHLEGLSSLEWLDLYNNMLDEFPLSPTRLLTLKKLDVADNYVNVDEALSSVVGVSLLDVYYQLQANLRSSNQRSVVNRMDGHKVSSSSSTCDSEESFHKYGSLSDEDNAYNYDDAYQDGNDNSSNNERVEENWDDDSSVDDSDQFDPNMLIRNYIPPGFRPFGWTPPKEAYEYKVPLSLLIRGFVYVPGEAHLSSRRFMLDLRSLPVADGQFDDCDIECASDLIKQHSFIECLMKKHMFVRNPLGVKQRSCTKCSRYDYCWHNGIWSLF